MATSGIGKEITNLRMGSLEIKVSVTKKKRREKELNFENT